MKTLIKNPLRKHQQGVTLIEMMIAMTLSLILLAGIVVIMRGSKVTYDTQGDASRIQEGARYALDYIGRDLRMTGYFGCSGGMPRNIPNNFTALEGRDNVTVGSSAVQSDVIRISYMDTNQNAFAIIHCPPYVAYENYLQSIGYATEAAYQAAGVCPSRGADFANFQIAVAATPLPAGAGVTGTPLNLATIAAPGFVIPGEINNGDILVASDCAGSDLYDATLSGNNLTLVHRITSQLGLVRTYNNAYAGKAQSYGSELRPLRTWRYYVAQVNRNGRNYFALCRDTNQLGASTNNCQADNELIEGVENLQVRYGVLNANNNNLQYMNAAQVTQAARWGDVVSVRLVLLMQSADQRFNREKDERTYTLDADDPNNPYDPPDDHRIRRVFSSTVVLRN